MCACVNAKSDNNHIKHFLTENGKPTDGGTVVPPGAPLALYNKTRYIQQYEQMCSCSYNMLASSKSKLVNAICFVVPYFVYPVKHCAP